MLSRVLSWRLCLIKSMLYTLLSISLYVALLDRMVDANLDITDNSMHFNIHTSITQISTKIQPYETTTYISTPTVNILFWNHRYLTAKMTDSFSEFNLKCVFTTNKTLFTDIGKFNAIVFDENILNSSIRPKRSPHQIFIFMSIESSNKYPACESYNEDFFNWTFTDRLDSDVLWRHYAWRDRSGNIIAPSEQVLWTHNSAPLRPEIQSILRSKTRAVVWMIDYWSTEIYEYVLSLEKYLHSFALKLYKYKDFKKNSVYVDSLSQNYQFVLMFACDDLVLRKVLASYKNYAVPVIYDGALNNYSRLLAPGSYIDAYKLHPYNLAQLISNASKNPEVYDSYFKWTNVYSIEERNSLCGLCEALHSDRAKDAPAKKNFSVWWNYPNDMRICLPTNFQLTRSSRNDSSGYPFLKLHFILRVFTIFNFVKSFYFD